MLGFCQAEKAKAKEESLTAKIELWKSIFGTIENLRSSYPTIMTILVTIVGAMLIFLADHQIDLQNAKIANLVFFGTVLLSMGTSILFSYQAYNFRKLAVLEGYGAKLEHEINKEIGSSNTFSWYSELMGKYIINNNESERIFLPLSVYVLAASLWILFIYVAAECNSICIVIRIIYVILISALFAGSFATFHHNAAAREECGGPVKDEKVVIKWLKKIF